MIMKKNCTNMLTLTTPSDDPVITTFCGSHSLAVENATHKICCILSARATHVLTQASSSPFILQRCSHVPAQVAMSPYKIKHILGG